MKSTKYGQQSYEISVRKESSEDLSSLHVMGRTTINTSHSAIRERTRVSPTSANSDKRRL